VKLKNGGNKGRTPKLTHILATLQMALREVRERIFSRGPGFTAAQGAGMETLTKRKSEA